MYKAPSWHKATNNKKVTTKLASTQRIMDIEVASGYRTMTISAEAAGVVAGIVTLQLLMEEKRLLVVGGPIRRNERHHTDRK